MNEDIVSARTHEDIAVGGEIIRHRLSSRLIHWGVAVSFLVCLGSGLPIWSPIFGWMAGLFGGLYVCRWLHPYTGLLFFAFSAVMFIHWRTAMKLEASDRAWLGLKMLEYLAHKTHDSNVGKYNGGQKLFFYFSILGAVALLASGLVLWFPMDLGPLLREAGIILHDLAFIAFFSAIVVHVYLGTAAEPGTFGAMIRGTVEKSWARLHHPRWFREVTGEKPQR